MILSLFPVFILFFYLRFRRSKRSESKHTSTLFLKPFWRSWTPKAKYDRMFGGNTGTSLNDRSRTRNSSYNPSISEAAHATESDVVSTSPNDINRNSSIRSIMSIMTLPPYRVAPLPSEQLIAREGERAGVDTVVEYPATIEEEEAGREEDMQSLYHIRQARRREINEREERRRERAAAREAGNWARLEQMRLESQARQRARADSAASSTISLPAEASSAALIAEHQLRAASRDRRVSSVSYASLGLARHDGTRIRADSIDSLSDQRPLLDSAASLGVNNRSATTSRRGSGLSQASNFPPLLQHNRTVSTNSTLSEETNARITPQTSPHGDRSGSDPPIPTPSTNENSISPIDVDHHASSPIEEPPAYEDQVDSYGYEESPPYSLPVTGMGRGPQLPSLQHVPTIQVTPNSVPPTPIEGNEERQRGRR